MPIARALALELRERHPRLRQRSGIFVVCQRPVLDRRGIGNWERPRIRFLRIEQHAHRHPRLVRRHDHKVHIEVEAERLIATDACHDGIRHRIDRAIGNVLVPRIVRRKHLQARQNLIRFEGVEHHGGRDRGRRFDLVSRGDWKPDQGDE